MNRYKSNTHSRVIDISLSNDTYLSRSLRTLMMEHHRARHSKLRHRLLKNGLTEEEVKLYLSHRSMEKFWTHKMEVGKSILP